MADEGGISPEAAARELLLRRGAQSSLLAFTEYTHPKWRTEPHHEKICRRLEQLEAQAICESCGHPINSLAVFAPPRSGKTELSLRRFTAWAMGRNPGWNVISAMANGSLASDTGGEVRDIVASPEYANIFPFVKLKADAQAAYRWIVESADPRRRMRGVYYCGGVDASFPGRGASILNIDDPHKSAQEADSPRMRELVGKFYFGDAVMRLEHPGLKLLTNTRRHEDDLAGRILPPEKEWINSGDPQFFCCGEWHVLRIRAIENEGQPNECAIRTVGCGPDEDPLEWMKKRRDLYLRKGESRYWNSEYQQTPTPEEGTYCKSHWYEDRYEEPPDDLWIYMTSDVAVTDKKTGNDPDFTEHGVFGLSHVRTEEVKDQHGATQKIVTADAMYVLDWWHGQTTPDEWIAEWVRLARIWRPYAWFGTKGVIRNAIEKYMIREARSARVFTMFEWLSDVKDKSAKGRTFQGMSAQGRVLFPRHELWADRVVSNVVAFPTAKHDDPFDTMANMARAMVEIPSAFSGAPRAPAPQEVKHDPWEYVDHHRDTKSWKGA